MGGLSVSSSNLSPQSRPVWGTSAYFAARAWGQTQRILPKQNRWDGGWRLRLGLGRWRDLHRVDGRDCRRCPLRRRGGHRGPSQGLAGPRDCSSRSHEAAPGRKHARTQGAMASLADAFIALPGGYGTLDEFFEIVTWAQLNIHSKPCVLINTDGYYDFLDLPPFLTQMVKTQNPLNGELSHGVVTQAVHEGV